MTWTAPYHGVSHYGHDQRAKHGGRWATITEWQNFTELKLWFEGHGFRPHGYTFLARHYDDHTARAKAAGEAWVATGAMPPTQTQTQTQTPTP